MKTSQGLWVIVQARMSSSRLPGKVLRPARGKPMLQYLLDRLGQAKRVAGVLVATSDDPSDDAVAQYCEQNGQPCFRGSLPDVASRYLAAAASRDLEAFVRVTGDSPLLDQVLVDKAVELYMEGGYDLVSNVLERSFPKGQSMEVMSTDALARAYARMTRASDKEHVTHYFYRHRDWFQIRNFSYHEDHSKMQLSVDSPEDWDRFVAVVEGMERPHWDYGVDEIIALAQARRPA